MRTHNCVNYLMVCVMDVLIFYFSQIDKCLGSWPNNFVMNCCFEMLPNCACF